MRKTLIIAAALAAMTAPAMAAEKTFDEMFPATQSIEEWCSARSKSVYQTNMCIDKAQIDYDNARILWEALSQARQEACRERWESLKTPPRARLITIHACLANELTAQDHEEAHHLQSW